MDTETLLMITKQIDDLSRIIYPPGDIQIDSNNHLPELIDLNIPSTLM